jgi:predicted MFS family arabinose efflux permease
MYREANPYRRFLAASAVSAVGDGLLVTGLPLLARHATSSPFLIAVVFAAGRVPWIGALWFGAAADRRDARKVMVTADLVRGFLLSALGISLITHDRIIPITPIILLSGLLAVGQILFFGASQRAVPALVSTQGFVGTQSLEQANSSFATLTTAGEQFIGPQLGAVFLTGGVVPVLGDALSFIGSAALLRTLPPIPPVPTTTSLAADVLEGWRWFVSSRLVRLITVMMTLTTAISAGALATEVILVQDTLGKPGWWFGFFTAVLAAGAMLGSWAAPRIIQRFGPATTSVAILATGLAYLFVAGQRSIPIVFGAMFVQQAATMVSLVATVTIRQRVIPDHLRGRVITLSRSFAHGSQIIGALSGGWIAEHHGTDPLFVVLGCATIIVAMATTRPLQRELHLDAVHRGVLHNNPPTK